MSALYDSCDFEPFDNQPDSEQVALREFLSTCKRRDLTWDWARRKGRVRFPRVCRETPGAFGEESVNAFFWRHLAAAYTNRPAYRYCPTDGCNTLVASGRCSTHSPRCFCACGTPLFSRHARCRECRLREGWSDPVWMNGRAGVKLTDELIDEAQAMYETGASLNLVAERLLARSGYATEKTCAQGLRRAFLRRGVPLRNQAGSRMRQAA